MENVHLTSRQDKYDHLEIFYEYVKIKFDTL